MQYVIPIIFFILVLSDWEGILSYLLFIFALVIAFLVLKHFFLKLWATPENKFTKWRAYHAHERPVKNSKPRVSRNQSSSVGRRSKQTKLIKQNKPTKQVGQRKQVNQTTAPIDAYAIVRQIADNGALIIDKPWIYLILSGQKTWEMRASKFKKIGYIGLIEKGSKTIVGIAKIEGYMGPLTQDELTKYHKFHKVPQSKCSAPGYKWFVAIQLSKVTPLVRPVPYAHKNGTVIWAKLSEQKEVLSSLNKELKKIAALQANKKAALPKAPSQKSNVVFYSVSQTKTKLETLLLDRKNLPKSTNKIPQSKTGKLFNEANCMKDGLVHLKSGDEEYRFEAHREALKVLRKLDEFSWATFDKNGRRRWQNIESWVSVK
jgi:hypothetical protein